MNTDRKRKITINDIAKEAGVSRSLVSSVLTNIQKGEKFYRVSEETTTKIMGIMEKYDYTPNYSAQTLRSGNSHTIGVILSDISNRFFSIISKSIMKYAQERGYMVIFANTDDNPHNLSSAVEMLLSKGVQAFIIVPCEGSEKTLMHYKDEGLSIILLDRDFEDSGLSSVTLDNKEAGIILTRELLKNGHKKVELVSYNTSLGIITDRETGYSEEMEKAGQQMHIRVHHPEYCDYSQVEEIILDAAERNVEALIFTTYRMALLGRKATLKHNVGTKFIFACFNNADTFDIYEEGMYYIMQPIDLIARKSVELIISKIEGESEESIQKILTPPQIEITSN